MLPDPITLDELHALMDSHNLTQYGLAKELSITKEQVFGWYHGKHRISKIWSVVIREHFKKKNENK